tara:strand:+ start:2050 stop:2967 length:918 start_codon:yes stop_codon:yes gene_type:complete
MAFNKALIAAIVTGQVLIMSGCSDSNESTTEAPAAATSPQTQTSDPHAGMNLRLAANQGKVLQISSEGSYSYAEVEQNGDTFWIAGSKAVLNPGDIVTWGQAQEMKDVHSKVLNRTFDSIYFVTNISTNHARTTISKGPQQAVNHGNSGKVISSQNAAGYTYLQVQTHAGERWIAAPQMQAEAGQMVTWAGGSVMHDFTSSSLNKTFAEIIFAGQARVIDEQAMAASTPASTQGKVLNVKSGGGYSYVEVETNSGNKWVAAPQTQIAVGDIVSWSGANVMRNFTSSALGQTFDEILFAGGISKVN